MLIIFLLIEITHGHIKMPMNALEVILNRKSIPIMDEPGPTSKQLKKICQDPNAKNNDIYAQVEATFPEIKNDKKNFTRPGS